MKFSMLNLYVNLSDFDKLGSFFNTIFFVDSCLFQ